MKFINTFGVLMILGVVLNSCSCVPWSAPFQLDKLLQIERTLIKKMLTYIDQQMFNKVVFDEDLLNFLDLADKKNREESRDRNSDTPLTSYHVLKRVINQWEEVKKNMSCTETVRCPIVTGEDVINNVWSKEEDRPTDEDIRAAALAIANVATVYNLSIADVISGKFPGGAAEDPLTADDIMYIADTAKHAGKTYAAVTWFEYLLSNLKDFPTYDFKVSTLYKRLASSYHEHGVPRKAVKLLQDYLQTEPGDGPISRDVKFYEIRAKKTKLSKVLRFDENDDSKRTRQRKEYERLCRDGSSSLYPVSNLTCRLAPLFHSYGQAKVETLSVRPKVERYHDILSEAETAEWRGYGNLTGYSRLATKTNQTVV